MNKRIPLSEVKTCLVHSVSVYPQVIVRYSRWPRIMSVSQRPDGKYVIKFRGRVLAVVDDGYAFKHHDGIMFYTEQGGEACL